MLHVPGSFLVPFQRFAPLSRTRSWRYAEVLLHLLLAAFAPSGPVVLRLGDAIERRRGKRISTKGIYRVGSDGAGLPHTVSL
jgi:hypothetical protein